MASATTQARRAQTVHAAGSVAAGAARGLGGNAAGAGVGGAVSIYEASKVSHEGGAQAKAIGGAAGGAAGAIAAGVVGDAAGAALGSVAAGAALGSVVPIVGTIIGAAIGLAVGGLSGGKETQKHGRFSVAGHRAVMTALIHAARWEEADAEERGFVDAGGEPPTGHKLGTLHKTRGDQMDWGPLTIPLPDGSTATFGNPAKAKKAKALLSTQAGFGGGGGGLLLVAAGLALVAYLAR